MVSFILLLALFALSLSSSEMDLEDPAIQDHHQQKQQQQEEGQQEEQQLKRAQESSLPLKP